MQLDFLSQNHLHFIHENLPNDEIIITEDTAIKTQFLIGIFQKKKTSALNTWQTTALKRV